MLSIQDSRGVRLCDGLARREFLRAGGISLLGMSAWGPHGTQVRGDASVVTPRAKRCIVLFLTGGPAQHSTWDPKPLAPEEIRGAYRPISTSVPGIQIGELMPETAKLIHHLAILRGVTTGDHAHSSSGYQMLTGQPHQPLNFENANPGPPNDWPCVGAVLQHLHRGNSLFPPAVRMPQHIFNTDMSVWPGQTSGFLGTNADPWLFRCEPASSNFRPPEFQLLDEVPLIRLEGRRHLKDQMEARLREIEQTGAFSAFDERQQQALAMLQSTQSISACDLSQETDDVRDRYGRNQFGQSVLMARRMAEAGVTFVQVNWFRGPDDPPVAPLWDSHADETRRLKEHLVPVFDRAFSALMHDLIDRNLLDETLVVCMSEFGRTPKFNAAGGRDHWGHVFSIAMSGGGIQGGVVHGASDAHAAYPVSGIVRPADITATIFHLFGYSPRTEIQDRLKRPLAISSGQIIREVLG